jgi:hypothetical protein
LTEAIRLLLLNHIPPLVGDKVVVPPTQMAPGPVRLTLGSSTTVIGVLSVFSHPAFDVKVNVALPPETPVTIPMFDTVATVVSLLTQTPPLLGTK